MTFPVPDQPGLHVTAKWTFMGAGTYEFVKGKLCETSTDIKLLAADELTKGLEKAMGTTLEGMFPKGLATCSRYELSDRQLTVHDEEMGPMVCTR